jgi:hypothetical protein
VWHVSPPATVANAPLVNFVTLVKQLVTQGSARLVKCVIVVKCATLLNAPLVNFVTLVKQLVTQGSARLVKCVIVVRYVRLFKGESNDSRVSNLLHL